MGGCASWLCLNDSMSGQFIATGGKLILSQRALKKVSHLLPDGPSFVF